MNKNALFTSLLASFAFLCIFPDFLPCFDIFWQLCDSSFGQFCTCDLVCLFDNLVCFFGQFWQFSWHFGRGQLAFQFELCNLALCILQNNSYACKTFKFPLCEPRRDIFLRFAERANKLIPAKTFNDEFLINCLKMPLIYLYWFLFFLSLQIRISWAKDAISRRWRFPEN